MPIDSLVKSEHLFLSEYHVSFTFSSDPSVPNCFFLFTNAKMVYNEKTIYLYPVKQSVLSNIE